MSKLDSVLITNKLMDSAYSLKSLINLKTMIMTHWLRVNTLYKKYGVRIH